MLGGWSLRRCACSHVGVCLLQYAEFIAALQPQIVDDPNTPAKRTSDATGSSQNEQAAEAPAQLLMQPEPGAEPVTKRTECGLCSSTNAEKSLDPGKWN